MSTTSRVKKHEDDGPGFHMVNLSGLSDDKVMPVLASTFSRWAQSQRRPESIRKSLLSRNRYIVPDSPYAKFKAGRDAVATDDIVGGVLEVASAVTLKGHKWEGVDADIADVLNQVNADLDTDAFLNSYFKDDYTYSQAIVALQWGRKKYTVRGVTVTPVPPVKKTDDMGVVTYEPAIDEATGRPAKPTKTRRRKNFDIEAPTAVTLLDPMKIVPLEPTMFGEDRLAWQSTPGEIGLWMRACDQRDTYQDDVMVSLFLRHIDPDELDKAEKKLLNDMGVDVRNLLLLNPDLVFRVAPGRAPYERFNDSKLSSVLPILDQKNQLMEADRVALVGTAQYILVVKIGTDEKPAQTGEIAEAREGVHNLAKIPLLVGDHRLSVEIVTPSTQFTLMPERYGLLDNAIFSRCMGSLNNGDTELFDEVSAGGVKDVLEAKRKNIRRMMELHIAKEIQKRNPGKFNDLPKFTFIPRNVSIGSDRDFKASVMALRAHREISRQTTLEMLGYDQDVEMERRISEVDSGADDVFGSIVPFSAPGSSSQTDGAQGGRPPGANTVNRKKTAK